MRYLTKEWYTTLKQACLKSLIRADKRAEAADEQLTLKIYNKKLKQFLKRENAQDIYLDQRKVLKRIDRRITRLTDETERKKWTEYRNTYACLHKKEIETGEFIPFDAPAATKVFNSLLERKEEIAHTMPKNILDKIADLRLFCLGYATQEVKAMVKAFSDEKERAHKKIIADARTASIPAEALLKADNPQLNWLLNFTENMSDSVITALRQEGQDVYVDVDNAPTILIKNAIITEREDIFYEEYNEKKPYCNTTFLKECELYFENGKYALHCLMLNESKEGNINLWYFTVLGTKIIIC